jgi:hypothetical protein
VAPIRLCAAVIRLRYGQPHQFFSIEYAETGAGPIVVARVQHAFGDHPMTFPRSGVELSYASLLRIREYPSAQNKDPDLSDGRTVIPRRRNAVHPNARASRILCA